MRKGIIRSRSSRRKLMVFGVLCVCLPLWAAAFAATPPDCDFNKDGVVDQQDLTAKRAALIRQLALWYQLCWVPQLGCGDLNGDSVVNQQDLSTAFLNTLNTFTVWVQGCFSPDISVTPERLDFGVIPLGTSAEKSLTIHNSGSTDLVVGSLQITGNTRNFRLLEGACPYVSPGGACEVRVVFIGNISGQSSAYLTIISTDPDESWLNVPLSGMVDYW